MSFPGCGEAHDILHPPLRLKGPHRLLNWQIQVTRVSWVGQSNIWCSNIRSCIFGYLISSRIFLAMLGILYLLGIPNVRVYPKCRIYPKYQVIPHNLGLLSKLNRVRYRKKMSGIGYLLGPAFILYTILYNFFDLNIKYKDLKYKM